jgi:quercetin dioxygenase-like cupin family protein
MTERHKGFWMGLAAGAVAMAAMFAAPRMDLSLEGEAAERAADAKYTTKVVLENERVRVRDVTFPPGVLDTGMHTHDLAHVGVILTKGSLLFTDPGGKSERVEFEAGSVGYRGANATHQVANPGTTPMRVIEVELK